MTQPKLLCLSNPMGLGHVTRDLAIIRALRELLPELEAIWLTAEPNISVLKEAGEVLHSSSYELQSTSKTAENSARGNFHYDSRKNYYANRSIQKQNAKILSRVLEEVKPELVFSDESAEILWVLAMNPAAKQWPLVILTDAIYPSLAEPPGGLDPLKKWAAYRFRRKYVHSMQTFKNSGLEPYLMLYVGTLSDIPDTGMGFGLPRLRTFHQTHFQPIGYVIPFNPETFRAQNRTNLKSSLRYDPDKKLIIASIGGIGLGREFLERIDAAAPELTKIAGGALEIVLVCGPRLPQESIQVSSGAISVRGYVPRLYEHFAAADFAIIKAGLTSTVELAALDTPFVYVPLPGAVEEELEVAPRLNRLGVGQLLKLNDLTPSNLAHAFEDALHGQRKSPKIEIPWNGAEVAAKLIFDLLSSNSNLRTPSAINPPPTPKISKPKIP